MASNNLYKNYPEVPKELDSGLSLIDVKSFDLTWDDVILNQDIQDSLQRVVLENRKQEVLEDFGLRPKSKLLFYGLTGCGKTLTAKVMSGSLGIPLVSVNLPVVFSSCFEKTSTNLNKIFDYFEKGEWVVLFDEFDVIVRDRNTLEVKRLVNSLLQLIDTSKSNSLFIATTNQESLLDNPVMRGFDEVLFFDKPDLDLRTALLKRYLCSIRHSNINLENFAADLDTATGADIESICMASITSVILRGESELKAVDLETAVKRHKSKEWMFPFTV